MNTPFRYRGYYYDTELALYYLNSRYYDANIGRFISPDNYDITLATPFGLTDKNLYAYCDNNPVMRADGEGDFWHIVVGAVAGALIGGVAKVVTNLIEQKSITDGLAIAMLAGAASGALASTGVGVSGMVAGNAVISMGENAVNQAVDNGGFDNFDIADMLVDGAVGAVVGAFGGGGNGSKHYTNLGKQTVKRTLNATANKGFKAGFKEAGKAFAYYGKNMSKYYAALPVKFRNDLLQSVATSVATSDFMKYQYRSLFMR